MDERKVDERRVLLGDGKTFTQDFYWFKDGEKIVKESTNITDLIEIKDLVHIIVCDEDDIDEENPMETVWYIDNEYILGNVINLIECGRASLLDIVTREQFESMKYHVGGTEE